MTLVHVKCHDTSVRTLNLSFWHCTQGKPAIFTRVRSFSMVTIHSIFHSIPWFGFPSSRSGSLMYAFSAALLRIDEAPCPVYRVPSVTATLESNESSSKARSQTHSATLNGTSSTGSTDTASQIYNPGCSYVSRNRPGFEMRVLKTTTPEPIAIPLPPGFTCTITAFSYY